MHLFTDEKYKKLAKISDNLRIKSLSLKDS
jgi:hypothetical protein